jgi:hypothetical protein
MSYDRTFMETEVAPVVDGLNPDLEGAVWAWATEHRAPEMASSEQLISWLARGELPPHVLVWKSGWGEWLPAMQVAELAAAFPRVTAGSRRVARAAPGSEMTPPAVPVAHYPRLRLLAKDVLAEAPEVPSASLAQGHAPAQVGRRAFRDPDHVQQDLVTSQVPVAAMLEAARSMQRPGTASSAGRWGGVDLGTFGEGAPPSSAPSSRTLAPLAVELGFAALLEPEPVAKPVRRSMGYGAWLCFGALLGGAFGVLSVAAPPSVLTTLIASLQPAEAAAPREAPPLPSRAFDVVPPAPAVVEVASRVSLSSSSEPIAGAVPKRAVEPAVLKAVRAAKSERFDRVVFEFIGRVPSYQLEYVEAPVRDCGSGDVRRVAGDGWLEVRFASASAHAESGVPSFRERELEPALSIVRQLERTCDSEGFLTWLIGTTSTHRYRSQVLSSPPRLVVDIDH